jgi:hypothetical protein
MLLLLLLCSARALEPNKEPKNEKTEADINGFFNVAAVVASRALLQPEWSARLELMDDGDENAGYCFICVDGSSLRWGVRRRVVAICLEAIERGISVIYEDVFVCINNYCR